MLEKCLKNARKETAKECENTCGAGGKSFTNKRE